MRQHIFSIERRIYIKSKQIDRDTFRTTTEPQTHIMRSNKEIEEYTDTHSEIKKRRLAFCGYIKRRQPFRLKVDVDDNLTVIDFHLEKYIKI